MVNLVPYFSRYFISERAKNNIPIKIISEPSKMTDELLVKKDRKEFRETRTMEGFKNIKLNQYMNEDLVAILGTRAEEPIGIVIYHKEFAKEQRIIFEKLWKIAKK